MKKLFKLLFLLALPLSLASCGETAPVKNAAAIVLDVKNIDLDAGQTYLLVPKAFDKDGNLIENKQFTYFSSNKNVATVSPDGEVTAIKGGYATITCIVDKQIVSCGVNVEGQEIPDLYYMEFDPAAVKVKFGLNYTPKLKTLPEDISGLTLAWNSSDEKVVTVADGVIHAVGLGEAKVFASYLDISAELSVTVVEQGGDIFTISLNKEANSIKVGSEFDLVATCSEEATITWESTDSGIAYVDSNGHVKGISKGKAIVSATANGVTASCTVTVTDGSEPIGDYDLEVYFYIDYNNVDEENPYAKRDWYVETPFGTFGDQGKPETPTVAPDPAFPKFAGWSSHPIIDNIPEDLWNFDENVVPDGSYVFVLYGIWIND